MSLCEIVYFFKFININVSIRNERKKRRKISGELLLKLLLSHLLIALDNLS